MEYHPNPDNKNIDQNVSPENEKETNDAGHQIPPVVRRAHNPQNTFAAKVASRLFNTAPNLIQLSIEADTISDESLRGLELSLVERKPRKQDGARENDAEHTLLLGMSAQRFAQQHRPDLDALKVRSMCDLHDQVEIYTDDVATYNISKEDRAAKEAAEEAAMPLLMARLPESQKEVLEEYKAQKSKEARFVRMFDKLMPYIVDVHGEGARVLVEDYNVQSVEEYIEHDQKYAQELKETFPEPELNVLHMIRQIFSDAIESQLGLYFNLKQAESDIEELQRLIETQEDGGYVAEWKERDDIEMSEDIRLKEEAQED